MLLDASTANTKARSLLLFGDTAATGFGSTSPHAIQSRKKSAFEACRSMRSSSCDDRPGKAIAGVPPLHGYLILREMQWDLPHSQKVLWDPETVAEWDLSSLPSPRLSGFSLKVETNCPIRPCDEEMKDGSPRSSKGWPKLLPGQPILISPARQDNFVPAPGCGEGAPPAAMMLLFYRLTHWCTDDTSRQ